MRSQFTSNRQRGRMRMIRRPTLRLRQRISFKVVSSLSILVVIGMVTYFQFSNPHQVRAAASGDYRAVATGNWNTLSTWQTYNGSSWVAAGHTPTSADGVIEIPSGDTVTVTASVTADKVLVDTGGTLVVSASKTLTIANGTGADLTVNGTLTLMGSLSLSGSTATIINGTVTNATACTLGASATVTINSGGLFRNDAGTVTTTANLWIVNSGGIYQSNKNGDALPLATWNTGATCQITGITSTVPTNMAQSFYNLTWNCTSQSALLDLAGITAVNGDFTMLSSGTGSVLLASTTWSLTVAGNYYMQGGTFYVGQKNANTLTVTGNYTQTGGNFYLIDSLSGGDGHMVMTVNGDFNMSAGVFNMSSNTTTANLDGVTKLYLNNNFTQSGGTIWETANSGATYGYGNVYFNKSGTQTFTKTAGTISNVINFTVNNGSILDMGTSTLTGGGTFTLSSGGGLMIGDANGITSSGASGNVQVTGTRSYSTGADYTYEGATTQVTGNGLPSTVHNFTMNNSSGLTLTNSVIVSNVLTLTSGAVTTSANTLTLGTSTSVLGTLSRTSGHVIGNLKRWIAAAATNNILFPLGADGINYNGANYSFTTAPTAGGSITMSYLKANPGLTGLPLTDGGVIVTSVSYGYWTAAAGNGLTGGTFSLDLYGDGITGITDYTVLRILNRTNSGSSWAVTGTHSAGTGTNTTPVSHRTGMTTASSFGHFAIGAASSGGSLPIKLMYFRAKLNGDHVNLDWATAAEINNNFFTIERSQDGITFETLLTRPGAGNSTTTLYYNAVDDAPLGEGYSYYRLKQTDYDGHYSYSNIESINNGRSDKANLAPEIKIESVAPNPFTESFKLNFILKAAAIIDLQIFDLSGQIIYATKVQTIDGFNTFEFRDDINLKKGIYFLNLSYADQRVTQKIVKQ